MDLSRPIDGRDNTKENFVGRIGTFLLVLTAMLISGCASGTPATPGGQSATDTPVPGSTGPGAPAPHTVALGDADQGRTVTVLVGDQVVLTLASTYWRFTDPNPATIVVPVGEPTVNAAPPS